MKKYTAKNKKEQQSPIADVSMSDYFKQGSKDLMRLERLEYPKGTIYHYTDFKGLQGILNTRRVWMSGYQGLNDDMEIIHPLKEALSYIKEYSSGRQNEKAWELFIQLFEEVVKHFNIYICSFCLQVEQKVLWEKYGKQGEGFAIGFRQDYVIPKQYKKANQALMGQKVHYNNISFFTLLKKWVERTALEIQNMQDSQSFTKENFFVIAAALTGHLLTLFPKIKQEPWSPEEEYRLIQVCSIQDISEKTSKQFPGIINKKVRKERIFNRATRK